MDEANQTESSIENEIAPVSISTKVVFYIFLLLDIPSILCSITLFYYFIRLPELRRRHNNGVVIYLLIGSFLITAVDIPLILPYLQNHYYVYSMKHPVSFCVFWIMYDFGLYSLNLWLMALNCFERYLFIFHERLIQRTRRRRLFIYYGLMTLIVLFVFFWFLYMVVLYPCVQSQLDFTQMLCGIPCYKFTGSAVLLMIDWVVTSILPVFLTIFFILLLISHLLYQRRKMSRHLVQQQTWQRTRKMFLQLLPVAFIFLVFNLPLIIVGILATSDPWFYTAPFFFSNSVSYCQPLCIPFAVLSRQSVIKNRLSRLVRRQQLNRTAPITMTLPRMRLPTVERI